VKHVIDESWSQPHALTLVDLNGDGKMELLTGKRFMAHDGHDPGEHEPLGIYWYEYRRSDDGKSVVWARHVVEYGSRAGGGMQIPVADIDGDGDLDFAVGGKSGLFLFENRRGTGGSHEGVEAGDAGRGGGAVISAATGEGRERPGARGRDRRGQPERAADRSTAGWGGDRRGGLCGMRRRMIGW
jgi:hypothetical protein